MNAHSLAHRASLAAVLTAIISQPAIGEVLIEESFDDQPDWTSGMHSTDRVQTTDTHILPEGWYSIRQDPSWAPSTGHPDRHEAIEILARNSEKARGGVGKSYVSWRDSTKGEEYYRWNSDSILTAYFPEGYKELYVSFWIRFGPNWTPDGLTGTSKLFRISHWDGTGDIYGFGSTRQNGPVVFWDYKHDSYGVRNVLAFRGHPIDSNYGLTNPEPINLPRSGNLSMNFDSNIRDLNGDGTIDNDIDSLLNFETGEPLTGEIFSHSEIWGTSWRKMEFYVKMNSGPGKFDGVFKQWMDGDLIFSNVTMPWMGYDSSGGIEWNTVSLGGNDHFHRYSDAERREEWYAIDDVLIATEPPADLGSGDDTVVSPPAPPVDITVE